MIKNLHIGQMRYVVTIQGVTRTRDTVTGAWTDEWATVRTTRAKREYITRGSGEGYEEDLQKMSTQSVALTIRKLDSEIETNLHRVTFEGNEYDIAEIRPSGYGERYLLLICELRNND